MGSRALTGILGFWVCLAAGFGCDSGASGPPPAVLREGALVVASLDAELAKLDARRDRPGNGCHGADARTPGSLAELSNWVRGTCPGRCPRVMCIPAVLLADRETTAALELSRTDCTAEAPCVLRNASLRSAWSDAQQPVVHRVTITSSHWWVRDLHGLFADGACCQAVPGRAFRACVPAAACTAP